EPQAKAAGVKSPDEGGNVNAEHKEQKQKTPKMRIYVCPSCGAEISTDETTAATSCYYCHNPIVLSDKLIDDYTPDYIIPFSIDRKKAEQIFTDWIKAQKYVPSDFYNKKQIDRLTGVYFPYWVYDAKVHASIAGTATRVNIRRLGAAEQTETCVYDIGNSGDMDIRGLSRIALKKASRVLCESVMPFDTTQIKEFSPGYLQGYAAEIRDIDKQDIAAGIKREVSDFAEEKIRTEAASGCERTDIRSCSSNIVSEHYSYALMPVWTVTYKAKDGKIYYFSINGSNGKTCGELPTDNGKLLKLFLAVFIPVFVILLMIFRFLL
ncbi:MAG: TFIIB-type zinc ribbon-containing protein, partial [bacterium]|nr:TFIIB-type zinc ribbon-containing protein [bacterium]